MIENEAGYYPESAQQQGIGADLLAKAREDCKKRKALF